MRPIIMELLIVFLCLHYPIAENTWRPDLMPQMESRISALRVKLAVGRQSYAVTTVSFGEISIGCCML